MSKLVTTVVLSVILASTTVANATDKTKSASKPADTKQYCLTFAGDTGSHLTRTECRTKKEWRQLGVDVDDLSASQNGGKGGFA